MNLKLILAHKIFSLFNSTHFMTRNMRKPASPMFGWVARTLNAKVAVDAVEKLQISTTYLVCEIGASGGSSLLKILKQTPQSIYDVEISPAFGTQLRGHNLPK